MWFSDHVVIFMLFIIWEWHVVTIYAASGVQGLHEWSINIADYLSSYVPSNTNFLMFSTHFVSEAHVPHEQSYTHKMSVIGLSVQDLDGMFLLHL